MKKSIIANLISGNWGDITSPRRLPIKDRQVGTAILEDAYPTPVYETETSNVITTASNNPAVLTYGLYFKKQGNTNFLSGEIKLITSFGVNTTEICQFNSTIDDEDSEYLPNDTLVAGSAFVYRGLARSIENGTFIQVAVYFDSANYAIKVLGAFPAGTYRIMPTMTYDTKY